MNYKTIKLSIFLLFMIKSHINGQNLKMIVSKKDSLSFIDYESDKKWIKKIESY